MKSPLIFLGVCACAAAAPAAEVTLDDAVAHALVHSPAAVAAEGTYLSARADLWQGWGNVMPSATTSYSANRYYDREAFRIGGVEIPGYAPPTHAYYASASATQPLFAGGALLWGVMSGRASARAGAAGRREQRDRLVVDVARAYYGVLKAEGLKEVAATSLAASRQAEEVAQVRYDTQAISRAEYLKAVVQRGQDEVAVIAAEAGVAGARLAFFNTVGMRPDETATFAAAAPPPAEVLAPLDDLINDAMARRPDVTRTQAEDRRAELAVRSARAGWLPTVGATATYDWSGNEAPTRDNWDPNDEWVVGVTGSWNLFDRFQTKATVDRARAAAASARAARDRLHDAVALDVTTAYYEYRKQAETLRTFEETAAAAEEQLNLSRELYALGGASALELSDAEALYVQANNSFVNAKYDLLVAAYELKRAMGTLAY